MEVRDLPRSDLAMLAAAAGPHRKLFVSTVFVAIIAEHGLHLVVERDGKDFALVGIETGGDAIVAERRLPIVWAGVPEDVRLHVLHMYVDGVLAGHRRWRRRMAPRLAALGSGSRTRRPRTTDGRHARSWR